MSASADISLMMQRLRQADRQTQQKALRRMDQFTSIVAGRAQDLTPVEWGTLQGSATTEPATMQADGNITAKVGYNTDYAAAVHDREFAESGKLVHHDPPGQAKFLSTSMKEMQPKLASFVGKNLI